MSDAPMFGPGSMTWRISREAAVLLGGRRALLMQLAHPLVAAAVNDHSRFTSDRVGRLLRTLRASFEMVFGDPDTSAGAIERVARTHASVSGVLAQDAGPYLAGTRYSAEDPELLMWVHATLIDTALAFYSRFVAPLSDDEIARYLHESAVAAEMIGIPPGMVPKTGSGLASYLDEMMSERLFVTEVARSLAHHLMHPLPSAPFASSLERLNIITIGTLPSPLREGYGFGWGRAGQIALRALTLAMSTAVRMSPPMVRWVPQAREAALRERLLGA